MDDFAEVVRALGDEYLQDVLTLRSGERWQARLPELIEEADVFQLFWSSNSMRSPYCREEWEHALALRRPLFVRPVYWEDPMPQDPTLGLPPVALRDLHFIKYDVHPARADTPADPGEESGASRASPAPSALQAAPPGAPQAAPAGAIPAPAAPSRSRRKRRFMAGLASAGATVFVLAIAAQALLGPKSHPGAIESPTRSSAASATASPSSALSVSESPNPGDSLAAGVLPLLLLLPTDITDPASQCSPYEPPYAWQMPGLVRALVCNAPGLPNGEVYAFQMNSYDSFQLSWANFNSWWGFDVSQAGRSCPPDGGSRQGAHSFGNSVFPPRAGQVLECQAVSGSTGGGSSAPAYAWALPSEDAFFVAQGADGSSFTALNSWWTTSSLPTPASPQAPAPAS